MDIGCFLLIDGRFQKALICEDLLIELTKSLRTKGKEEVYFMDRGDLLVEGVYIPAKGSNVGIMALGNSEEVD